MKRQIIIEENGIHIVFEIEEDGSFKLLHFSALPFEEDKIVKSTKEAGFNFVELNLAGFDRPHERHGNKFIVTAPGYRMKYISHTDTRNEKGRFLEIITEDPLTRVQVHSVWQFYDGLSIVRMYHIVENQGKEPQTMDYISTFNYTGIEKEGLRTQDEKLLVKIPHNGWQRELNWKDYSLKDLGMDLVQPKEIQRSSNHFHVSNTGNWSAKEYLPMAYLENLETGSSLYWQIEHNGSWHWEIGDQNGHLYLALGGPNELYSHWFKTLKPGESFTTVPAAVRVSARGFDDSMAVLTRYRRLIRRKNQDNETCRIIFNDYMNCLFADPTTEKELPLIDEAARAGCEYFCIDAGWYAKGFWWDAVGEWIESRERFPKGIREVTDYIRAKGMIPGIWLELEVMGINCEMAKKLPDDWFFTRHGKRVYDRSRYQLDYRNPKVREYATSVIDRLIRYYATIAANAPAGLTPEQAAVWSYPLPKGDREEVVFNMVNAMLLRVHQSGHLNMLSQERKDLVKEGLDYYKAIRYHIKEAVPFWPLGLSQFEDERVSLGLRAENKIYLAVWRRSGNKNQISLPLPVSKEEKEGIQIRCAYPSYSTSQFAWNSRTDTLTVQLEKENMARLFEITLS